MAPPGLLGRASSFHSRPGSIPRKGSPLHGGPRTTPITSPRLQPGDQRPEVLPSAEGLEVLLGVDLVGGAEAARDGPAESLDGAVGVARAKGPVLVGELGM